MRLLKDNIKNQVRIFGGHRVAVRVNTRVWDQALRQVWYRAEGLVQRNIKTRIMVQFLDRAKQLPGQE